MEQEVFVPHEDDHGFVGMTLIGTMADQGWLFVGCDGATRQVEGRTVTGNVYYFVRFSFN